MRVWRQLCTPAEKTEDARRRHYYHVLAHATRSIAEKIESLEEEIRFTLLFDVITYIWENIMQRKLLFLLLLHCERYGDEQTTGVNEATGSHSRG